MKWQTHGSREILKPHGRIYWKDARHCLRNCAIKGDFAVAAAAEGLALVRQLKTQRFQRLFLLGSYLAVLVLAVEHMALVDVGCAFVQMQCPVQHMNVFAKLGLELVNELRDDVQQVLCGSVFIQRSQLIDGFFRAGFLTFKQVLYGSVALGVANLRIAGILVLHKVRIVDFIEHLLHIAECSSLFILVGCRTDAMIAIPVDVAFSSFLVDVLTVGKVETAVIVLGVIGAVGSGSSIVSC